MLDTHRLLLSPLAVGDAAPLHTHWTLPGVRRYLWDDEVISSTQVEDVIRRSDELFSREQAGLWTIRLRSSRELAGCTGFWYFHDPPEREVIFSLSPSHWGQGIAHEAVSALFRHVFEDLQWLIVQGSADTPNHASLALMRRLGMQRIGERSGRSGPTEVFQITREEWSTGPRTGTPRI